MEATLEQAKQLGLQEAEFEAIKEVLGRTPNFNETAMYSVMWSEHCSYKNSIKYLKKLPRDGSRLLVKAGEENAGLVDIGDGLAIGLGQVHELAAAEEGEHPADQHAEQQVPDHGVDRGAVGLPLWRKSTPMFGGLTPENHHGYRS